MKNNSSYKIQNACINCRHIQPIGDYSEETTYHCTKWLKLIYRPPFKRALNMATEDLIAINQASDERFKETHILPNGICDDYKGK